MEYSINLESWLVEKYKEEGKKKAPKSIHCDCTLTTLISYWCYETLNIEFKILKVHKLKENKKKKHGPEVSIFLSYHKYADKTAQFPNSDRSKTEQSMQRKYVNQQQH